MIEIKNVTKKYGNFYAVRNMNFSIKDGEIIGLLGKNGAGKTTTMNMITGFIEPTEGTIIIDGFDIEKKPKNVKSLIGYMPEGVPLYTDLTVKEFIAYMADLKMINGKNKKEAIEKTIDQTGLKPVENKLTRNLSRGYKQRVSLAGALVGNPKILILDEPTVGLDPKQVIEIRELIKSLRKDHTVILSSHILSEVSQVCEKVIIIDKGEVVAIDTPENLEKSTEKEQEIIITVEDNEDKFLNLKELIKDIRTITLVESVENTKTYKIEVLENKDIRKDIFENCSKENISILEMKKQQKTLEEAFIKIVDERPELTQKEIEEIEIKKEIEEYKEVKEDKKKYKEEKKENKKQQKQEKKRQKKEKKEEKNNVSDN